MIIRILLLVGGIPTPLKNDGLRNIEKYEFVSWDDYSQYMVNNPNVPNHQPEYVYLYIWSI